MDGRRAAITYGESRKQGKGRTAVTLLILLVGLTSPGFAQKPAAKSQTAPVRFTLVPEKSKIQFFVSSSLSDVNGAFKIWHGSLRIPTLGSVNRIVLRLNIDANSMTTGNGAKDGIIKGKDFFWVEQYPSITFNSTKVLPTGDPSKFQIQGDFTLRGVTKQVTLEVKLDPSGTVQGIIHGDLSFDRTDFGMTKNMPFNKVADTVKVTLDVDVERSPASHAAK